MHDQWQEKFSKFLYPSWYVCDKTIEFCRILSGVYHIVSFNVGIALINRGAFLNLSNSVDKVKYKEGKYEINSCRNIFLEPSLFQIFIITFIKSLFKTKRLTLSSWIWCQSWIRSRFAYFMSLDSWTLLYFLVFRQTKNCFIARIIIKLRLIHFQKCPSHSDCALCSKMHHLNQTALFYECGVICYCHLFKF